MIHDTQLVRDIAIRIPAATHVFHAFKIDYCCKGHLPLADAAAERGVPMGVLCGALSAMEGVSGVAPATPAKPAELIAQIISRYHVVHLTELPDMIVLARKVERAHPDHPCAPRGLADHLAMMADDLQLHQHKEETILFPMMQDNPSPMLRFPIERMTSEHDDVAEQLLRLAVLTTDFTAPEDACSSWRTLYRACAKLDADLREHIHLENNVLFPQFL